MRKVSPRTITVNVVLAVASVGYAMFEHQAWPPSETDTVEAMLGSSVDTLNSPTFIAFVAVTAWLVYCVIDVRTSRQLPRLLRLGSYLGLVADVIRRGARCLSVSGTIVVLAASTAPLLVDGSGSDPTRGEPAIVFDAAGLPLVVALLSQVVLLGVLLLTVRALIELIVLIGRFPAVVAFCSLLWVWAAASAAGFIDSPVADLRSYSVLAALVGYTVLGVTVAVTYVVVGSALVVTACFLDLSARDRLPAVPRWVVSAAAASALICFATVSMQTATTDLRTHLVVLFFGPSGTILQMLIELILIVGYVLLVQQRLAHELNGWSTVTSIRYGSRVRLVASIMRSELLSVAAYCACLVGSSVAAYVIAGGRDTGLAVTSTNLLLAYQLTVAQFLQLTFCVVCVMTVTLVSRNAVAGLSTVGVFAALFVVPIPADVLVPVQRSTSSALYFGGWGAAIANTALLVTLSAAVVALAASNRPFSSPARMRATRPGVSPS